MKRVKNTLRDWIKNTDLPAEDRKERDRARSTRLRSEPRSRSPVETEEEWLTDDDESPEEIPSDSFARMSLAPTSSLTSTKGAQATSPEGVGLVPTMVSMWDRRLSEWDNRVTRVLRGENEGQIPSPPVREIPVVSVGWKPATQRVQGARPKVFKKREKERIPRFNKVK